MSADDPEHVTAWALRQIGVDDAREQCMTDEQCQRYAVLFRHARAVREAVPTGSYEHRKLTDAMYAAELALRRYVTNASDYAIE